MIAVRRRDKIYHFENEWLSTYWHFSFDHYYDPRHVAFGPLRVLNDDTIRPRSGFPRHPHRDMEIVTVVLAGALEHEDDQGNRGLLRAGEVQVMSAGTGIVHAERNPSADEPLHLLQIWILPTTKGLPPRWEQRAFSPEDARGRFLPMVTGDGAGGTLRIDQRAVVARVGLEAGEEVSRPLGGARRAYLVAVGGEVSVNGQRLRPGDAARLTGEATLSLTGVRPSEAILLDLP